MGEHGTKYLIELVRCLHNTLIFYGLTESRFLVVRTRDLSLNIADNSKLSRHTMRLGVISIIKLNSASESFSTIGSACNFCLKSDKS